MSERGKYIEDLRAALGRQTLRADKAERQVRDLAAELKRSKAMPPLTKQDVEDICHDILIGSSRLKGISGDHLDYLARDIAAQIEPRLKPRTVQEAAL